MNRRCLLETSYLQTEWKALEACELNLITTIPSPKSYPSKQWTAMSRLMVGCNYQVCHEAKRRKQGKF